MFLYKIAKVSQAQSRPPSTSEAINFEPIKIQTHQAPQNDGLNLDFVKDKHKVGGKMARNSHFVIVIRFDSDYSSFFWKKRWLDPT